MAGKSTVNCWIETAETIAMLKKTGNPGPPSRIRLKRLRRSMGSIGAIGSVGSVGSVRVAIAARLGGGLTISAGHGQRLAGELHADPTLRRTCIESVEGFLKGLRWK